MPGNVDGPLDRLLFRQDGVLSRRQALQVMPEASLRRLVSSGRWARPCRGVLVAHNGPLTRTQRAWVAALYAGRGRPAPLAGLSALVAHGLRGYPSDRVHVCLPIDMHCPSGLPFLVVHRTRCLGPEDLHRAPPPRTAPARSVLDAARWAANDDLARTIIAAAFQQRLDAGSMRAALGRLTRVSRRDVIVTTINDAAGGSESVSELDFLRLCRLNGLPVPSRQVVVRDAIGRRCYRDAYFEPWRVHVEIDGGQHMEIATWWRDMRRQNEMWTVGDRVLRFPAWALRNDPAAVAASVRAALVAAGWQPVAGGGRGRRRPVDG